MTERVVVKKNSRESIVISENSFNGRDFIDLRVFYEDADELKPTKKGMAISVDKLSEVIAGLQTYQVMYRQHKVKLDQMEEDYFKEAAAPTPAKSNWRGFWGYLRGKQGGRG